MSDKDTITGKSPTAAQRVVELDHAKPKQDLWDLDDDIFKPLLEKVEQERRAQLAAEAAERAEKQTDPSPSLPNFDLDNFFPQPVAQLSSHPPAAPAPEARPKPAPVAAPAPLPAGPVTIRSAEPGMPRVIWQDRAKSFQKFRNQLEKLSRRTQMLIAGTVIFALWMGIALIASRFISLSVFAFDPFYPRNWSMLYSLYNSGSTFQWSFIAFYMAVFVFMPVLGLMVAVRGSKELQPMIEALEKIIFYVPRAILRALTPPAPEPAPRPQAYPRQPQYRGASFKIDPTADSETKPGGGSIGGGGGGGGHGRPSWQGGPANTQAFPRAEQGRR